MSTMRPNRSRPIVYDTRETAREIRERFAARPVEREERFTFGWPSRLQNVGDSLAAGYGSDKWKPKGPGGHREVELYKHLAESRNRCLALPGVIHDYERQSRRFPVIGPMVSFADVPMPKHFAALGFFEEVCLKLYTRGDNERPRFGAGDDGIVHITVAHGHWGGAEIPWSRVEPGRKDQPFIFVYQKQGGVLFLIVGKELAIEKDGIVG